MNILIANPSFGTTVARQLIAERVADADQRRVARELRGERRTAIAGTPHTDLRRRGWAVRLLRAVLLRQKVAATTPGVR